MLVDPDDGAVDHHVLEVQVSGQNTENPFEYALHCPSSEALEDRIPVPELGMQIAPRRAGPSNSQNRFQKPPVVGAGATGIARLAGEERRNPLPLVVVQYPSVQAWSPFSSLESDFAPKGNPHLNGIAMMA